MYQQGCVRECPAGFTSVSQPQPSLDNEVDAVLHPTCLPCHELCLTCSGTGSKDCLSCPPHSHLDQLSGTCQHQNQIQRESPDAMIPSHSSASSGILNIQLSSSLPATVAVLCCAFIAATFVVVFGLLQFRSYNLTKTYSSEASVGSVMRNASFSLGMSRSGIISYKGIPSMWNEDGGNSESDNDEFDIHNERTAFIKTQSAL